MLRNVLFVAIGGALGSVGRYLLVLATVGLVPFRFPVGTFVVNILGSFVMGAAVGLAERYVGIDSHWRLFLTAGFCGGFTTFSAFAFENVELFLDKNYGTAALYTVASLTLCVLSALAGLLLTRT
jgi:CrcB protein